MNTTYVYYVTSMIILDSEKLNSLPQFLSTMIYLLQGTYRNVFLSEIVNSDVGLQRYKTIRLLSPSNLYQFLVHYNPELSSLMHLQYNRIWFDIYENSSIVLGEKV